jgi:hypothetical protein
VMGTKNVRTGSKAIGFTSGSEGKGSPKRIIAFYA